jgi:hypothetical protein
MTRSLKPMRRRPSSATAPLRRFAALVLATSACVGPPIDEADLDAEENAVGTARRPIAGNVNRNKIAMAAPWRMEPDPSGRYGAIPITVSIMDNDAAEEESVAGAEYASISKIVVKEKVGLVWRSTEYPLSRFHEIEAYKGRWDRNSARNFSSAPCMPPSLASMTPGVAAFAAWAAACPSEFPGGGLLCRNWRASNGCAGVDVGKLSDKGG